MRHFNSQPHKEADRNGHTEGIFQMDFNSQPHKEADGVTTDYLLE